MTIFAFTVGSLGDIISLIQLAKTVTKALCDSKGSSAEYFELILEIDSVVHTVEGVQYELSIEGPNKLPAPVENGLHHSIRRCLDLLRQMNEKISAWRRGFGSGWTFGKDAWRKLGWCLFTREELIGLRRRLSGQIEAMNTLLILAHGERLQRFSRKQDEHSLEIRRKQDEIALEIRRITGDYPERANVDHHALVRDDLSRDLQPSRGGISRVHPLVLPTHSSREGATVPGLPQRVPTLIENARLPQRVPTRTANARRSYDENGWDKETPHEDNGGWTEPQPESWETWLPEPNVEPVRPAWRNVQPRRPRRGRRQEKPNEADPRDGRWAVEDNGGWAAPPEPESWATWHDPDIKYSPPPTPPPHRMEEPLHAPPAWRNVHPRTSRRGRRLGPPGDSSTKRPDEADIGQGEVRAGSWATWQPDPRIVYTPPPSDVVVIPQITLAERPAETITM